MHWNEENAVVCFQYQFKLLCAVIHSVVYEITEMGAYISTFKQTIVLLRNGHNIQKAGS